MIRILALAWPQLRTADADVSGWERMLDALDDLSPRVEAVDLGVALVDVTGLGPMWGTERRIAARAVMLTRAVAPFRVRCGIGDNRWLATLAVRLARFERPEAPAAFATCERDGLRDLPLALLPADPVTRQRFALFGLTTFGQLADLPRSAVGAQFGPAGERLQALARGHDPRPIVPRRRPERLEAGATFEPALEGVGAVGLTLRRLATDLCDRLRVRHLAPGRAALVLRLEDAPPLRVAQAFPQPALEPDWIARLLLSRIEAAARSRRAALPNSNHLDLSRPRKDRNGREGVRNMGKSMTLGGRRPPEIDRGEPKVNAIAIWREQPQKGLLEEYEEPRVASVTLAFDRLSNPATTQLPAFEARAARWEELRWSLERIRHRFGEGRLWRAVVERETAALPEHRSRLVELNG